MHYAASSALNRVQSRLALLALLDCQISICKAIRTDERYTSDALYSMHKITNLLKCTALSNCEPDVLLSKMCSCADEVALTLLQIEGGNLR